MSHLQVEELESRRMLNACSYAPPSPLSNGNMSLDSHPLGSVERPAPGPGPLFAGPGPAGGGFGAGFRPADAVLFQPPFPGGAGGPLRLAHAPPQDGNSPPLPAAPPPGAAPAPPELAFGAAPPIPRDVLVATRTGVASETANLPAPRPAPEDLFGSARSAPQVAVLAPPNADPRAGTGGIAAPDANAASHGAAQPLLGIVQIPHGHLPAAPANLATTGQGGISVGVSVGLNQDQGLATGESFLPLAQQTAAVEGVHLARKLDDGPASFAPLVDLWTRVPAVALTRLEQGVRELLERVEREGQRAAAEGPGAALAPWLVAGAAAAAACEIARRQVRRTALEPVRATPLLSTTSSLLFPRD